MTEPKIETRPVGLLIEDKDLYIRKAISSTNVANIAEALLAGKTMRDRVVITPDNVIVDGIHRCRAYERVFGSQYVIDVVVEEFDTKAAMLDRAMELNTARGMDLNRWDLDRCVQLAEEHGLGFDRVASLLGWKPDRLRAYRESRMGRDLNDKKIALKRSIRHKLGQPLTDRQVEANQKLSGMTAMFHVNQLLEFLEADLMPEDEGLVEKAEYLGGLLTDWAAGHGSAESA